MTIRPFTALTTRAALVPLCLGFAAHAGSAQPLTTPLVDTMQDQCYDLTGAVIDCPAKGEALYGQDAQHPRLADAREKLEDWRRDYNEVRPHSAIGYNVLM